MFRSTFITGLVSGLLLAATPALAAADAASIAAATTLVNQLQLKERLTAQLDAEVKQMRTGALIQAQLSQSPGFEQARAAQPQRFADAFKRIGALQANGAQKVFTANIPAVVDAAIKIYADVYTTQELKGITEFARSPLGAAYFSKQGRVDGGVQQAMMKIIGPKMQAASKAVEPQIKAELSKLQGPPPKK
jgi:hypothetical protein